MDTGFKISLCAHGAFIALALVWGPLFDAEASTEDPVTSVALLSADEFADLLPSGPRAIDLAPDQPKAEPINEELALVTPTEPTPAPEQNEPESLPEQPDAPDAPEAPENPEVTPPKPAEIIATEENDPVEEPGTEIAPEPTPETTPEVVEEPTPEPEPVPEPKPEAPAQTTTQIVTEAETPKTFAPEKSPTPKRRPRDLDQPKPEVAETKPDPKPEPEPKDTTADDILAALQQAEAEAAEKAKQQASTTGTGGGNKLSEGEINGLILKVQNCWSVPVGLRNAADLVVVVGVELSPYGRLLDVPKLIEPTGTLSPEQRQAFEAARRALIACQPYQDLPEGKYESWNKMEVVFNPKKMVAR